MEEETAWIASVSQMPLHVTGVFPRYHMMDRDATETAQVYRLAETAGKYLKCVFTGNCRGFLENGSYAIIIVIKNGATQKELFLCAHGFL